MKAYYLWLFILMLMSGFSNPYFKKCTSNNYKHSTYYKNKVYEEHTLESFYLLSDIRKTISMDSIDIHLLNACLFFATNKLRYLKNKPMFMFDTKLKDAAAIHSCQMEMHHFFAHENHFEKKLYSVEDRLKYNGIKFKLSAENCSKEYIDDEDITYIEMAHQIIEGLYLSPPHKSNLMHTELKYCASAAAVEKVKNNYYILVTMDFYK